MTVTILTNASAGATRNSGTNGDLTTLLDWALPQAGWTIEYTSGNARVYRPGSGNRFRLHVYHDSAISGDARLATVRGCEDASNATTLIDPFPTVAQLANASSNWRTSTTASTVDRPFRIYLSETWVLYMTQYNTTQDVWDGGFFGDVYPTYSGDIYNTVCWVRNQVASTANTLLNALTSPNPTTFANGNIFWCRDITGATKSSYGMGACSGGGIGNMSGQPSARAGYLNQVVREAFPVNCAGSNTVTPSSLSLGKRGYISNIWSLMHQGRGTLSDLDTFEDSAYNPSAIFRTLSTAAISTSNNITVEETDTWSPP